MTIESIQAKAVTKRYGHHRALANVDVELKSASVCALLGPNGAGKSTLLGILSTLVRPSSGAVSYRNKSGKLAGGAKLRAQIGVLAHDSFLYSQLDAYENLRFFGKLYAVADLETRIGDLLDEVDLEKSARTRAASTYSRGMLQRLSVARAMLSDPAVLLFDEPFTGLDRGGADTLSKALASAKLAGRLVVVVTHDLDPLDGLADQVIILRRGKVTFAESRTDSAFSAAELKAAYAEHSA